MICERRLDQIRYKGDRSLHKGIDNGHMIAQRQNHQKKGAQVQGIHQAACGRLTSAKEGQVSGEGDVRRLLSHL